MPTERRAIKMVKILVAVEGMMCGMCAPVYYKGTLCKKGLFSFRK
jgi:hypothetical protein